MILGINMVNKNRGLFLSPLFLFKSFELTTEVIEHNHIIFYAERVQEIKHSLGHHWRAAEVVLDVLWSVVLLELGIAHHWSNEARSVLYTQCIRLWIWTVQCQVEMEVRILLLQCQEILQEEYLVNSTSTIEIVHLAVLGRKGLKHVHNKSTCELLYAIAEGLTTLFLCVPCQVETLIR